MGYKLAGKVQAHWSHLDHGPFRLLLQIALALPEDSTRCWMGRDRYAAMLGKSPAHDSDNVYKAVQRTIKSLVKAGALKVVSPGKPGQNAVYELQFTPSMGDAERPPSTEEWRTPSDQNGGHSVTPMGDAERPQWGTLNVPPKKDEEDFKKKGKTLPPSSLNSPEPAGHENGGEAHDQETQLWGSAPSQHRTCVECLHSTMPDRLARVADIGPVCDDCRERNGWDAAA